MGEDWIAEGEIEEFPVFLGQLYAYVGNNSLNLTDPSGLESQFPAAVDGLNKISKLPCSQKCKDYLKGVIGRSGRTDNVDDLIRKIQNAASAATTQLFDGETSNVSATVFGRYAGDAEFVKDKFKDATTQAMSGRFDNRIWLRPRQWKGNTIYSMNNKATPLGMGVLMDELLHKNSVGGFVHQAPGTNYGGIRTAPPIFTTKQLASACFGY